MRLLTSANHRIMKDKNLEKYINNDSVENSSQYHVEEAAIQMDMEVQAHACQPHSTIFHQHSTKRTDQSGQRPEQ